MSADGPGLLRWLDPLEPSPAGQRDTGGTEMSKIAFSGRGQMGTPMATRLLDAGHELVAWNRTPGRATPLVERGASLASSPLEAAAGVEFAITTSGTPEAGAGVRVGP